MILQQRRQKANSITLIELLLVMALIGIVMGSLQFGVGHLLREQAFVQKVGQIKEAIALTQEMMMDTRADLTLRLHHQDETIFLKLHSTKPLPEKLTSMIERVVCPQVKALSFNEQPTQELLLYFDGHLGRMSKGEIVIEKEGGKRESIRLQGFPGRLS